MNFTYTFFKKKFKMMTAENKILKDIFLMNLILYFIVNCRLFLMYYFYLFKS